MIQRIYEIYVNDDGAFEVLPRGYSLLAASLQPIWAIANGTYRYFALWLPLVPLGFLAAFFPSVAAYYIVLTFVLVVYFVLFPLKAFKWRGDVLRSRGYKVIFTTRARSWKMALARYAEAVG